jgi:hypothetical protein
MAWRYNAADLLCMPATPASSGTVILAETIDEALQRSWGRGNIAQRAQSRCWDLIARDYCERLAGVGGLREALA